MSDYALIYDGTFDGFLSAVFEVYDRKIFNPEIIHDASQAAEFFNQIISVDTNEAHAAGVWRRFKEKVSAETVGNFNAAFLSEYPGIEKDLLAFMRYVFSNRNPVDSNYGNEHVVQIARIARMVHREKHRTEAFVRFQLMEDGIYYAPIEPDFNVLPLISKHFTSRYADQRWVIYDLRRRYGLYYDLEKTEQVTIEFSETNARGLLHKTQFSPDEEMYQQLWKTYFKSVNIPSRKNMKMHLHHVPKRYWKLLPEKMK